VAQLSCHLTQEELVGWAAFFELKSEQEDKARDRVQTSRGAQTMGRR
jgi:hypothetical protein|tara:strand:+ start:587 stop:727 length:141 start_codon:yes stop_codon:yes gene_type:complete